MQGRQLYHLAKACGQGQATATILGKNRASAPETAFSTVPQIIKKHELQYIYTYICNVVGFPSQSQPDGRSDEEHVRYVPHLIGYDKSAVVVCSEFQARAIEAVTAIDWQMAVVEQQNTCCEIDVA